MKEEEKMGKIQKVQYHEHYKFLKGKRENEVPYELLIFSIFFKEKHINDTQIRKLLKVVS